MEPAVRALLLQDRGQADLALLCTPGAFVLNIT